MGEGKKLTDDEPKFGDLACFVKGGLRITDDGLLSRLNRPALSPSSAKAMHGCSARWVAERVLQRPELFAANTLGTAAHTVTERLYLRPPHSRTQLDAMGIVMDLTEETFRKPDPNMLGFPAPDVTPEQARATRALWATEVTTRVNGIFDIENPAEVETLHTELEVKDVEVNGVPFLGYIDRVDRITTPEGIKVVRNVDLKFGRQPEASKIARFGDDHGDQLRLYHLALQELNNGKAPDQSVLHYGATGKSKRVATAKARLNETARSFKESWEILHGYVEAQTFNLDPGPLCGWCPLVKACPAAQATGRTPRIAAPEPVDLGMPVTRLTSVPDLSELAEDSESDSAPFSTTAADEQPDGAGSPTAREENDMSLYATAEPKPWENQVTEDGTLSGNGYATIAACGLLDLATDLLVERGIEPTRPAIEALRWSLDRVLRDAQQRLSGSSDLGAGLNTRLRGLLRTTMKSLPVPLPTDGKTVSSREWEDWTTAATRRLVAYAEMAHEHVTGERPADPHRYFTGEPVKEAPKPARATKKVEPEAKEPVAVGSHEAEDFGL